MVSLHSFLPMVCFYCVFIALETANATVTKISWTLSKPPAKLFRWETTADKPSYEVASLSPGNYILQAIAQNAAGTSTHSGTIQGTIGTQKETINIILNPLIQADAVRFQQPSYIEWIKTNSTTVYPGDEIEITIRGKSNPANSDMKFTADSNVKCTSKTECKYIHTIPGTATDPYTIQYSIVGMGYSVPLTLKVKDFVPIEFRAVFNVPPTITSINSGISLLHQIGASTTVTASFTDAEGSNVKYTWTTEAIQGSCPLSELSGTLTDTVPSGSTVSVVFTPTTLGNKCIVKIRCEDVQKAASLGEVYIFVDTIPSYFPPYVISKLQSKQVAKVGDAVDFSLEMCEPQQQMVNIVWSTSCGTLDHASDSIASSPDCHWIYNKISGISAVPCTVTWTATDTDSSVLVGKFRMLANNRRLKGQREFPIVKVITDKDTLTTVMDWSLPLQKSDISKTENNLETKNMSAEGVVLIVILVLLFLAVVTALMAFKMRKVRCVYPIEKEIPKEDKTPEKELEMRHENKLKAVTFAKSNAIKKFKKNQTKRFGKTRDIKPPAKKTEIEDDMIIITPEKLAEGARRQMKIHKQNRKSLKDKMNHMLPSDVKDMHVHPNAESVNNDFEWESNIKKHSHSKN
tara:strand:- start:125 stop:2017 length:1893 start_codon:yes stop_codon:yes gene_type:complete